MPKLYEGMFLVDNDLVREDWKRAKGTVTGLLEKHGADLKTIRRFAERRLAYPIKHRKRGTYILSYFEADGQIFNDLRRDLDLSEPILRYLFLRSDAIPEGENELSEAEQAPDFEVPPPPMDDEPEPEEEAAEGEEGEAKAKSEGEGEGSDEKKADDAPAEGEAKAEETKTDAADEVATAGASTETGTEPTKEG